MTTQNEIHLQKTKWAILAEDSPVKEPFWGVWGKLRKLFKGSLLRRIKAIFSVWKMIKKLMKPLISLLGGNKRTEKDKGGSEQVCWETFWSWKKEV